MSITSAPSGESTKGFDRVAIVVYLAMAAALGILLAMQTIQERFSGDVFAHLAVIRELSENPFNPMNPFVAAADTTFYFSPYTVALGLLGKVFGIAPVGVLGLAAILNFVLVITGFWLFSRSFSTHRWAPHLTLFIAMLPWGFASWRWSGFWSLDSIGFGLGYPSMFAGGLALIALSGLWRWFSFPNRWMILGVAGTAGLIVVTHQFTAMWLAIAALAIVATRPIAVLRDRAPWLLGAVALAASLALLWPYYPILDLLSSTSASSEVHTALYRLVLKRGFLLLPGAVAVVMRWRTNVRDPLLWMFIGGIAVYGIGWITGLYGLGRVIPLIAISTNVALAYVVAGWLVGDHRRVAAWSMAIIGVAALIGAGPALVRMVPRALLPEVLANDARPQPLVEPYSSLSEILRPTDVVMASGRMNRVVPAIEGRVVVPGYLTPLLTDRVARDRDVAIFFSSASSPAVRAAIAERWNASYIVVQPADPAVYPWLAASYPEIARTNAYVVFSLS